MTTSALRHPMVSSPDTAGIGRDAIRALYAELALHPKPGLVSPLDNGSHDDMDMATFMRSLFALRGYFRDIATAGAEGADFGVLRGLGIQAERRMLVATGGINTHRGAIFSLGLLAAASGALKREGQSLAGPALGEAVSRRWGQALVAAGFQARTSDSHGARAVRRYQVRGAREEAAEGFPLVFGTALPAFEEVLVRTGCIERALVQTLFTLMSVLEDTNLLHRGGTEGLGFVREGSRRFLDTGGVLMPGWREEALALHRGCVARHLSPGGSADLLAATWFVYHQRLGARRT